MHIKQHGFNLTLPTHLPSLFIVNGHETFLAEQFREQFKQAWLTAKHSATTNNVSTDYQRINIIQPQDWQDIHLILNNYSLLSPITIVDIVYDKKTLDQHCKDFLRHYLDKNDPLCLVLLHLPQTSGTALKFLADDPRLALISVKTPDQSTTERWIAHSLQTQYKLIAKPLPRLIYQYTQGNLLACSQVLQKIKLAENNTDTLTEQMVQMHLGNQCDYQLYELSESCLSGDAHKSLLILRHVLTNHYELTFILWIVAQEIRLLIQLNELSRQANHSWPALIKQLKIWPSKANLYQTAFRRISLDTLTKLLSWCKTLDLWIKTSQNQPIQTTLELLVISFCLGKEVKPLG